MQKSYYTYMNTFITNQKELLKEIIQSILPVTRSFDVLVGYFFFSGFKDIDKQLKDIQKIKFNITE